MGRGTEQTFFQGGNADGEVTTDTAEIQSILRDDHKQLYANKMDNQEEMDKFVERYNLQIGRAHV